MQMPGGGFFSLMPGQFTDDSELAIHMLQGLLQFDQNRPLEEQENIIVKSIGKEYVKWFDS